MDESIGVLNSFTLALSLKRRPRNVISIGGQRGEDYRHLKAIGTRGVRGHPEPGSFLTENFGNGFSSVLMGIFDIFKLKFASFAMKRMSF